MTVLAVFVVFWLVLRFVSGVRMGRRARRLRSARPPVVVVVVVRGPGDDGGGGGDGPAGPDPGPSGIGDDLEDEIREELDRAAGFDVPPLPPFLRGNARPS